MQRTENNLTQLYMVLAVGVGGAIGAASRWLIQTVFSNFSNHVSFPWATLFCNLTGCLLLSFITTVSLSRNLFPPLLSLGVTTGFMGSLTTFSTLVSETYGYNENAGLSYEGLFYFFLSYILGVIASLFGYWVACKCVKSKAKEEM